MNTNIAGKEENESFVKDSFAWLPLSACSLVLILAKVGGYQNENNANDLIIQWLSIRF